MTSYISPAVAKEQGGAKPGQVIDYSITSSSPSTSSGGSTSTSNGITYSVNNGNVIGRDAAGNVVYDTSGFASGTAKAAAAASVSKGLTPGSAGFVEANRQYESKQISAYNEAVASGYRGTYGTFAAQYNTQQASQGVVSGSQIASQQAAARATQAQQRSTTQVAATYKPFTSESVRQEATFADQQYVALQTGLPLATVIANWDKGSNLSSKIGKMSYSSLTEKGLAQAELTGKGFIAGLGYEITSGTAGGSNATSEAPMSKIPVQAPIFSEMTVDQIIANYERQGYTVIPKSTMGGVELTLIKPGQPSAVAVAQPQATGTVGYLNDYYKGYESRAEQFQKGFESLPVVSSFVSLDEDFINRIQTFKGKQDTSLGQAIGDIALAPPMLGRFIYKLPEIGAKTFGGTTKAWFLGLEGARTGDFAPLKSQVRDVAVSTAATFTDPSALIQLAGQSVLIPAGGSLFRRGVPEYKMTTTLAVVEDAKTGIYGTITEGKFIRSTGLRDSTDLMKVGARSIGSDAIKTDTIMGTTYRGSLYGNLIATQKLSPIERVIAEASNAGKSLIAGKRVGMTLERIEYPYGTFSGRFTFTETSQPVLEASKQFGTVPATGIADISGVLKSPAGAQAFSLRELSLERIATPANPIEVASGLRMIEGSTGFSSAPTNALIKVARQQAEAFTYAPRVPLPVKFVSSLTEGTIAGKSVMSSGTSVDLFKFQTRAGEASLSAGETFSLLRRGGKLAAYEPMPSFSVSLNRLGLKPVNFEDLGRILRGEEMKIAESPGKRFGRYAREPKPFSSIGANALKQLEGRPLPKLLTSGSPAFTIPKGGKVLDFGGGNFAQVVSRAGTITIQKTAERQASRELGAGQVQLRGGMVQLQKPKPLAQKAQQKQSLKVNVRPARLQGTFTIQPQQRRVRTSLMPSLLQAVRQNNAGRIAGFISRQRILPVQKPRQDTFQPVALKTLVKQLQPQPTLTRTRITEVLRIREPSRTTFIPKVPGIPLRGRPPPPTEIRLPVFRFKALNFLGGKSQLGKRGKQKFAYQPSLTATSLNIKAKVPKGILKSQQALGGFEFRPISGGRGSFAGAGVRMLKALGTMPKKGILGRIRRRR